MWLQHSADSGNGSSIPDPSAMTSTSTVYCFDFPADMCGMLIGRKGTNIKDLKDKAGCEITVKDKMYTLDFKLICLEGNIIIPINHMSMFMLCTQHC